MGILIFKGLTARRIYKSFGVKELIILQFSTLQKLRMWDSVFKQLLNKPTKLLKCNVYSAEPTVHINLISLSLRLEIPMVRAFLIFEAPITHSDTPQPVGLLRTSDQLVAETST
jgi:hypothetical protein